jgi:hypothetical protein
MVPEVHARALKAKELYWPTYGLFGQLLGCFSQQQQHSSSLLNEIM